jgi:hypothetical protein
MNIIIKTYIMQGSENWSLVMLLKELDLTMKTWRVKDNQNYEFMKLLS